ncbi:MAG: hypothetical protein PVF67_08950 [Anaerolineae bacterium]|jgi:hypothetical protein
MAKGRVITVRCQCGERLFKYYKGGRGRLIKCYLHEIREDYIGLLQSNQAGQRPVCPNCGKELGMVRLVRGQPALKINQGTVQGVRL